ncbi:hypothetical protein N7533_012770 [Penicillium manginii]|jgi:hypothetical protein|uniref:uncharacterized protein n=1 Tax=Penicillium manginii TaxID=203109 RepID=UPI0025499852|nr:uncharacterized protein N7533_012770 [Penicillium manginii]KAJ5739986.1 hypothetical protein N7533_012770 [Penicillium manginii]
MGQTEPGLLFVSPHDMVRADTHPTIYSDDDQLVWQGVNGNHTALEPQMLNGEPVIAYWEGLTGSGFGFGHISIICSSYDEIHRVTLSCKDQNFVTSYDPILFYSCIDLHEIQFTKDGTILVTAVNVPQADLTSMGGPKDGWIQDGLIYEIDIKNKESVHYRHSCSHVASALMNHIQNDISLAKTMLKQVP